MLVSYNWLKDFLDLDIEPNELAEKITRTGVEIADVIHPQSWLKKIVVGHVLTCDIVEGTHLHVTKVNVGEAEPLQIVCGAPNIAAGQKVIVALHGARIAGNEKIKRGKIRGIQSEGMICGLQEIGFDDKVVPAKYANGIFVFDEDTDVQPGDDIYEALGMDDYILDFDITPNRADTLSMEGAAYEVGAIIDQTPKIEEISLKSDGQDWTNSLKVSVDPELATKFYLRKITGIKICSSPLWMQRRLWNAGIRPINNVVDVTNYVMLLTGQPLHVYDATTFSNGLLEVRRAHASETLQLLNDKSVELDENDIVITDGNKPVMLAGVMGGKASEVTDQTTDIILESAIFNGSLVRKSALRHANRTEASSRFEKGVNSDNTMKALDIAALLLRNNTDGTILNGIIKGIDKIAEPVNIRTTISYINKTLGTNLKDHDIIKIFDRLNFPIKVNGDELVVNVPHRRWDISIAADLVEEVGRIYGYDNLISTQPLLAETHGGYSPTESIIRRIKKIIQGQGMLEAISYSLTTLEKATSYALNPKPTVKIAMPLNTSRSVMRQNLICGLLDAAAYNMARNQSNIGIYEQGRVYYKDDSNYIEHEHIAALYSGNIYADNWQHLDQNIDFYYVKGQLTNIFIELGLDLHDIVYKAENIKGMHPTRTAAIYLKNKYLGMIGMLSHEELYSEKALRGNEIYVYELDLDVLIPEISKGVTAKSAPKFPAINRDLSLLIDAHITNDAIISNIKANAGKYLTDIKVIDVYEGSQIEAGKKSIAYSLTFRNEKETLTDEVVSLAIAEITHNLESELGAVVR